MAKTKARQTEFINDPDNYREMSKPFASPNEANGALTLFFDEVRELRKKHRIRDVHMLVSVRTTDADGVEGDAMSASHLGDPAVGELMLAWGFGRAGAERRQTIRRIMTAGESATSE